MKDEEATLVRLQALRRRRPDDQAFYYAMTLAIDLLIGFSEGMVEDDITRLEHALNREVKP
jgi:hypothetical protein